MTDVIERMEILVPGPAEAFGGLLDVPVPNFDRGEGLPLAWHWFYLLERPNQSDLGTDGHPVRGAIPVPPGPGRRRMWAGGQIRSVAPLRCGEPATRRTTLLDTTVKEGRSGTLTFCRVGHQIEQDGAVAVEERQDIVYRDVVPTTAPPDVEPVTPEPTSPDDWVIDVSPTLLFRFSALTYNAHRIHYDRGYARDVEGYPGLLTHGPLQAIVMAESARARGVGTTHGVNFDYRLVAPLFDHQGLVSSAEADGDTFRTAIRDVTGRKTAKGTITWA